MSGALRPVPPSTKQDVDSILGGGSISAGYNLPNLLGVQATGNFSGTMFGSTVGVPGTGVTATYSFSVDPQHLFKRLRVFRQLGNFGL